MPYLHPRSPADRQLDVLDAPMSQTRTAGTADHNPPRSPAGGPPSADSTILTGMTARVTSPRSELCSRDADAPSANWALTRRVLTHRVGMSLPRDATVLVSTTLENWAVVMPTRTRSFERHDISTGRLHDELTDSRCASVNSPLSENEPEGSYNQNLWIDHLIVGAAYLPR